DSQLPVPPFTAETALQKTKAAEAAWNSKDPAKVAGAYSPDTIWRNRDEIFAGESAASQICQRARTLKSWSLESNRFKGECW
ncbi:unnamed protein product, partial [Ascophyllum nodosum]